MNNKKNYVIFMAVLLMSCFISGTALGFVLADAYGQSQYLILSGLTEHITARHPEAEEDLVNFIKNSFLLNGQNNSFVSPILSDYGYTPEFFASGYIKKTMLFTLLFIPLILLLLCFLFLTVKRAYRVRILELTSYLELVNLGNKAALLSPREDEFSKLEDEIYKTVTWLCQTREAAVEEQKNLADNLADISHQIKTPLAAISLMTQLLAEEHNHSYIKQIRKQTAHLEQLVGTLLTLSRIDAGALKLEKNKVDIYTLLQLSLETLDPVLCHKNIQVSLPNHPELFFEGDMEWSMEAFINLIKNCVEHTPEDGFIKMEYEQNPLYVQIRLEDNGPGFPEKDLPHIFERFYKGENASEGSAGIGLALAKAIIEGQNGIIRANNLTGGGACFIIRFYRHRDVTLV